MRFSSSSAPLNAFGAAAQEQPKDGEEGRIIAETGSNDSDRRLGLASAARLGVETGLGIEPSSLAIRRGSTGLQPSGSASSLDRSSGRPASDCVPRLEGG